ncbi:MAG: alanine racemase [Ruminococcaceae bacterium]|nr:alanine racemase [Oscillospiraceae bacterium]
MEKDLRAWAEIDLDAIGHNTREIKRCLSEKTKLMGVIKADAYGHGAVEVAAELLRNGADQLAVAFADEAVELRRHGFDVPILILGNSTEGDIEVLLEYDIMPAVSDYDFAEKLSKAACTLGKVLKIHIKLDTGMSRIGFLAEDEKSIDDICRISKLSGIELEGLFTHFATADETDEEYTKYQFQQFVKTAEALERNGINIPVKHVCNSAGLVKFPEMQLDMVRAGIIIYGLYPSKDFDHSLIDLKPAMTFKSRISHIKYLDEGTTLSYGRSYTLEKESRIATVAVGYADGYSRCLSNRVNMLVKGNAVRQLGRICMDQCMIDISAVNNINVGDEVVLFGGTEKGISADDIAEILGTISYEVVCAVSRRIPRIYIKNGRMTGLLNYLL